MILWNKYYYTINCYNWYTVVCFSSYQRVNVVFETLYNNIRFRVFGKSDKKYYTVYNTHRCFTYTRNAMYMLRGRWFCLSTLVLSIYIYINNPRVPCMKLECIHIKFRNHRFQTKAEHTTCLVATSHFTVFGFNLVCILIWHMQTNPLTDDWSNSADGQVNKYHGYTAESHSI